MLIIDSRYKRSDCHNLSILSKNMPRLNRTGPLGYGPGSGWRLGPCGGGMAYGRRGGGRGQGLGWRRFWGYYPAPTPSKKEETEMLSEEAGILEEELKAIKSRLVQLKGQNKIK